MSTQEFNTLLEKFINQKISKEELQQLEELTSQNPEFKKEYDQYRSVIQGIKSSALREELKDIMDSDSPNGKFPVASYNRGKALLELGRHIEAIHAFEKAEKDSPHGEFPLASNEKGATLFELGKYQKAIFAFEKAEKSSPNGEYPDASYNKGIVLLKQENYEVAISAFEKAEKGSPHGKYADASNKKGFAFYHHGRYKEALTAFEKAEKDSPNGKFPVASCNKGNAFLKLGMYKEAVYAFEKAEKDSPNGKYPEASYGKGFALYKTEQNEEAINAYDKAEKDSPSGKYPVASLFNGLAFSNLGMYEEAIQAWKKAEQDSHQEKYPDASINKGIALVELKRYNEAINSFEKAEMDGPNGKFPLASYNKGKLFRTIENIEQAILAFKKALNDSENNHYPSAHLRLAEIYSKRDLSLAKYHAYEGISQDDRNWKIVNFISEYLADPNYQDFYKNRLEYLYLLVKKNFEENKISISQYFQNFCRVTEEPDNSLKLFCTLLQLKQIDIPLSLTFDDRLRLAYLIYYLQNKPWYTFHIIDSILDVEFSLCEMDYYFYLLSAIKIAEPYKELEYYLKVEGLDFRNPFAISFNQLTEKIAVAHKQKNYIDPYLLNIEFEDGGISNIDLNLLDYHPIIIQAIKSIKTSSEFTNPLKESELKGLLSQLFLSFERDNEINKYEKDKDWINFLNSTTTKGLAYDQILYNIRTVIKKGIPYWLVLNKLFEIYSNSNDNIKKKNIAILQAVTLYSHHFDYIRRPIFKDMNVQIATTFLLDLLSNKAIGTLITFGMATDLGITFLFSYITSRSFSNIYEKWDKKRVDEIFKNFLLDFE